MEERVFQERDVVRHFKRELVDQTSLEYLYKICARPYDMFVSEVDREKYPEIKQKYRFEVIK